MTFEYHWTNREANFGPPMPNQIPGGAHISLEIILRYNNNFVALRRPNAIPGHELPLKAKDYPNGLLYFCHDLVRYGEPVGDSIRRIVREQAGVDVKTYKVVEIWSEVQAKDKQWAFTPAVIVEIENDPELKSGDNAITAIVKFNLSNIPNDFGWWGQNELKEFLSKHE
ncbi:MAG: hypothetical protein Q8R12_01020 [bacterium]|nr:hypothetical protein [bacterium]